MDRHFTAKKRGPKEVRDVSKYPAGCLSLLNGTHAGKRLEWDDWTPMTSISPSPQASEGRIVRTCGVFPFGD